MLLLTRLLLVAGLALGLAAAPAHAASKKPCKRGHVALKITGVKRPVCVRPGAEPKLPGAEAVRAKAPAKARKALDPAALRRLRLALDRGLPARASTAALAAATAGADGCAAAPNVTERQPAQVANGVELSGVGHGWGAGGTSTHGVGVETTAKDRRSGMTSRRTEKTCWTWDACPDASGVVTGRYEWSRKEVTHGERDGAEITSRVEFAVEGTLKATVGSDARVQSFAFDAIGTASSGGEARYGGKLLRRLHVFRTRTRVQKAGIDPRRPSALPLQQNRAWGTSGQGAAAAEALILMSVVIPMDVARGLLAAETRWYDQFACLDVAFDPAVVETEPGGAHPVGVRVKAKEGDAVAATVVATATTGAVTEPGGPAPASVTWTAPDELSEGPFETFTVVATSNRGRARGAHSARKVAKAPRFAIEIVGGNTYSWATSSFMHAHVGTDSECNETSSGSGKQELGFLSPAYAGGVATVGQYGGHEYVSFAPAPLSAWLDRAGTYRTTRTGRASNCNGVTEAPRDGCDRTVMRDLTPEVTWEAGTVRIRLGSISGDPVGRCPFWAPVAGQPLSPGLLEAEASLPMAWLKDPNRKTVEVTAKAQATGREDCSAEEAGGCTNDPPAMTIGYQITATIDQWWILRLTRLD